MSGLGLAVHAFVPCSLANGPGWRAVLWLQGCTLACPGCFNPETHAFSPHRTPVRQLADRIAAVGGIEGLTISGGEPLQQRRGLEALLQLVRAETDLSVVLFTGYRWDEIAGAPLLRQVDVVIAGRYDHTGRTAKTVHVLTDRYSPADMDTVPDGELVIDLDGSVVVTGRQPISMSNSPTSMTPA